MLIASDGLGGPRMAYLSACLSASFIIIAFFIRYTLKTSS